MKSALTRLTILFGVSLMLCMSSGAGMALAHKTTKQPTNPGQFQYTEKVQTIHGPKHTGKRHTTSATGSHTTTSTGASGTHSGHKATPTVVGKHHKTKGRKTTHHKVRKGAKSRPAPSRSAHANARSATAHPTAAVTTGSGGGISTWLLVIVILVLVSGSAAGLLRYRRSH